MTAIVLIRRDWCGCRWDTSVQIRVSACEMHQQIEAGMARLAERRRRVTAGRASRACVVLAIGLAASTSASAPSVQSVPPPASRAGQPAVAPGGIVSPGSHPTVRVQLVAYCPCRKCCGRSSPEVGGHGLTASGRRPVAGRTVAADPRVFPIGSVLEIEGRRYHVEDTGSGVVGHRVDVFVRVPEATANRFPRSHEAAKQHGRRVADALVLRLGGGR